MPDFTPEPWTLRKVDYLGNDGEPRAGELYRIEAESTLFLDVQPCSDGYVPGQTRANAYLLWAAPAIHRALIEVPLPSVQGNPSEFYSRFYQWFEGQRCDALSKAEAPTEDALQVRLAHKAVAEWDGVDDAELIGLLSESFGRDLFAILAVHDDGKQVIQGEGEPY